MSIEIARYQFHSWARKGISANISDSDDLGGDTSTTIERTTVPISVKLNGAPLDKTFALIGPGDIIGINRDMVVRTEPLNGITDYEPNYLPFIEFYDEDFTWRYTPAKPQGDRLRPWIFLLVLKETEFERTKRVVPLPTINVTSPDAFPPAKETWLWAHVHSNADIPDAELSDYEKFLRSINKTVNDDPDQLYSRLISPRHLDPECPYHAFLIPAFETGRLAGLGQPTDGVHAQLASWDAGGPRGEMPVYFEWFFRTGTNVDFESLVKALEPRPMDPHVGIRDMDASRPGFVRVDDATQEIPGTHPPLIGLEGALKAPTTVSTIFPDPPAANEFQVELQKVVNIAETIAANPTEDPIISVPLYGKNHAKKSLSDTVLLDITKSSWVHDLNRDPRTRVAGGFGTRVVQKNQDLYMRKAWAQVQQIIDANRRIKLTRFMMSVAFQYTVKTFSKLPQNALLSISSPILSRVKGSPETLAHMIRNSRLPGAALTGAFRRITRPKGALVRKLGAQRTFYYNNVIEGLNSGTLTASPPLKIPAGVFTTEDIATTISPYHFPAWLLWLLQQSGWIYLVLLAFLFIFAVATGSFGTPGILAAALALSYPVVQRARANASAAGEILDSQTELNQIPSIPPKPGFTLQLSDETSPPAPTSAGPGQDSVEARNFRTALVDITKRLAPREPVKMVAAIDLANAYRKLSTAIDPHTSFPYRLSVLVKFPGYISVAQPETIFPAMAYPDFEDPMYEPLRDISSELLLPNLKLIPPNTISLLETNRKFIESYLIGLNHEMGRELLWREYPTDQRGSYFRQFWDVKGIIQPVSGTTEAQLAEEHKDIVPIDTWASSSDLGTHDKHAPAGNAQQLVLVVRGDLLKRYPNTIIFAQKAIGGGNPGDDPVIDLSLDDTEFNKEVKFPLYKAEISPDIKFFGFDLTVEQARGTEPTPGFTDTLGWFFILQEVPGEPRFGMDISFEPGSDGVTWDDLSWENFGDSTIPFITGTVHPTITPSDNVPEKWGTSSADMAYVLFQKPSMVAIHAKEMLENV